MWHALRAGGREGWRPARRRTAGPERIVILGGEKRHEPSFPQAATPRRHRRRAAGRRRHDARRLRRRRPARAGALRVRRTPGAPAGGRSLRGSRRPGAATAAGGTRPRTRPAGPRSSTGACHRHIDGHRRVDGCRRTGRRCRSIGRRNRRLAAARNGRRRCKPHQTRPANRRPAGAGQEQRTGPPAVGPGASGTTGARVRAPARAAGSGGPCIRPRCFSAAPGRRALFRGFLRL